MKCTFVIFLFLYATIGFSQTPFTHADTLRGSNGKGRKKWDVLHYDITVEPNFLNKSIVGKNIITIVDSGTTTIQIDLQEPMQLDSVLLNNNLLPINREKNVYWVEVSNAASTKKTIKKLSCYFHGIPRKAVNAPWDGGWIWKKDSLSNPFVSVACQGLGASVWYPCKDQQSAEPSKGAKLTIIVPDSLTAVGNGKLLGVTKQENLKTAYTWEVKSPINNYNIIPYIAKYVHFSDVHNGKNGQLPLDYWVLSYHLNQAKTQFKDVKRMLKAFEYWFGPYPFYEDGFKLVEAPHLGMEHQSAIAYGNKYQQGYLGRDLSQTGWGMKWDFIIVHESGHEWFANNITSKDIADMWIHEGFTTYSETLFIEYFYGKNAANAYIKGLRNTISNTAPIIGRYGVNNEGSSDMYNKGGNMIHTIRQIINSDKVFRNILIGLNKTFYHQTVTTRDIEQYISKQSGIDFSLVFDQYLRNTSIPCLEYYVEKNQLFYRWTNTIPGFKMKVKCFIGDHKKTKWLNAETHWQSLLIPNQPAGVLTIDDGFYVTLKQKIN